MKEPSSLEKHLQDLLAKSDFEQLTPFRSESAWSEMTQNERELLALLLMAEGEHYLQEKNSKAHDSFDAAARVAPHNPQLFYRQAMALAMEEDNASCLNIACKSLEKAVALNPNFFEAWHAWGNLLMRIGASFDELSTLQKADEKFLSASQCCPAGEQSKLAHLCWQWGLCWQYQGKLSGEACDLYQALEKYRQAEEAGLSRFEFWNDYGDATASLSRLLSSKELLFKASDLYRAAIKLSPDNAASWCSLSCCLYRIFEFTNEEIHFSLAQEGFSRAAGLNPQDFLIWLNWGALLAEAGKRRHDMAMLSAGNEKFVQAAACEQDNSALLSRWGEALLVWGTYSESIELLREAQTKLVRSLEIDAENVDTWYFYGICLSEIGRYFSDESFYKQSIEKFEYAFTLSPQHPLLWHGCALAHFALGDMNGDIALLETASAYCTRVFEYSHGVVPPHFWNDWGVVFMKLSELSNVQQHVESAIEKFEQALGLNLPEEERRNRDPEWWYNYGCALDFLGDFTEDSRDYERAIGILTQVLEHDPSFLHVRYNLALAWSHLAELTDDIESFQKAIDHFHALLQANSEDEGAWNDCGVALINLSQLMNDPAHPEKAREILVQAEAKFMQAMALGSTQVFYNLACLYSLNGNYTAAMHFLERSDNAGSLPAVDDMLYDDWLDGLRQTPDFRQFLIQLASEPNED